MIRAEMVFVFRKKLAFIRGASPYAEIHTGVGWCDEVGDCSAKVGLPNGGYDLNWGKE